MSIVFLRYKYSIIVAVRGLCGIWKLANVYARPRPSSPPTSSSCAALAGPGPKPEMPGALNLKPLRVSLGP